jgi:tRNA(fMet)-specific endonuclease VapC
MKYLLDTNICVYFLNENPSVVAKTKSLPPGDIALSIITLAELQFGAWNSTQIQKNLKRVKSLRKLFQALTLNLEITELYAKIKAGLRQSGNIIDDFDILIGATALIHNLILVTNNEQHFSRMKGLPLENWTREPL